MAIRRPRAHHVRVCVQIDMVKIVSVDLRVLTLNVAHQTTKEGLFEAQADLEERRGRESVHKSTVLFLKIRPF